jgi:hypothetical protein
MIDIVSEEASRHGDARVSRNGSGQTVYAEDPRQASRIASSLRRRGFRVAFRGGSVIDVSPAGSEDITTESAGERWTMDRIRRRILEWRRRCVEATSAEGFRKASARGLDPSSQAMRLSRFVLAQGKSLRSISLIRIGQYLKRAAADPNLAKEIMNRIANPESEVRLIPAKRRSAAASAGAKSDLAMDAREYVVAWLRKNGLKLMDAQAQERQDQVRKSWEKWVASQGIDTDPTDLADAWRSAMSLLGADAKSSEDEEKPSAAPGREEGIDFLGLFEPDDSVAMAGSMDRWASGGVGVSHSLLDSITASKLDDKQVMRAVDRLIEYYSPMQHPKTISPADTQKFLLEEFPAMSTRNGVQRVHKRLMDLVDIPERHEDDETRESRDRRKPAAGKKGSSPFAGGPGAASVVRLFAVAHSCGCLPFRSPSELVSRSRGIAEKVRKASRRPIGERKVFLIRFLGSPGSPNLGRVASAFPDAIVPAISSMLAANGWKVSEAWVRKCVPSCSVRVAEREPLPEVSEILGAKQLLVEEDPGEESSMVASDLARKAERRASHAVL